jgi:hypothetical protein
MVLLTIIQAYTRYIKLFQENLLNDLTKLLLFFFLNPQILQCLTVQGSGSSSGGGPVGGDGSGSGVSRASVKDRFKTFNSQFEELHQRQSQWTVPDSELRESLRLAVAEVVLPAYRSFLRRFGHVSSYFLLPVFRRLPFYFSGVLFTYTNVFVLQAYDREWEEPSKVHKIHSRRS